MSPNDAPTYVCNVCGGQAAAITTAECNWCDGRFHLNQRNDVEAKDCGQVWIDEQYLALQFACNACLAGTDRDPTPAAAHVERIATAGATSIRPRRYKRRA